MHLHLLSDGILLFSIGFVIRNCFSYLTISERIFWASFLIPIALGALLDIFQSFAQGDYTFWNHLLSQFIAVVGSVGVMGGVWSLLLGVPIKVPTTVIVLGAAIVLFVLIANFQAGIMAVIFQPFCIIFSLMVASWGLINRRKSALWLVIALMILAFSLKKATVQTMISPVQIQHYLTALSILLIGYAIRSKNEMLFR